MLISASKVLSVVTDMVSENLVLTDTQKRATERLNDQVFVEPDGPTIKHDVVIGTKNEDVLSRIRAAVRRQVKAVWRRAGVDPWERLWQTLRQSCEKEWAMRFPQFAVSKWMGHSITIFGRHYANEVPDELFARAAGKAAQKAAQRMHETRRNDLKGRTPATVTESHNASRCENLRQSSASPEVETEWSRGESNPRPVTVNLPPLHA